ncbi:MAG: PLP-dependent aminotransferase family protein [Bryobacterales bacterium]|nr:PLP-dependent aminotransferase family protein [Bryobacterales bacterium]
MPLIVPLDPQIDPEDKSPLFRQLHARFKEMIESGALQAGNRLPATRELAHQLGLNRTTVSAAYALLEADGLINGHVGRGSFVAGNPKVATEVTPASFSRSRPSDLLFPLDEFRKSCAEVIASVDAAAILQLGSPSGYPPLRRYLLEQSREEGAAREGDDILITSGCQQAFDLLQRVICNDTCRGSPVMIEDPVYLGVRRVFERADARLLAVPVERNGIDLESLERMIVHERPRLLCVTPNFQNPTGATMPLGARQALLRITQAAGVTVIENDIYGPLCYEGEPIAAIKCLDETGDTILLRSFSKVAFPGLRVGWVIARRALIEKLTEAKQWSDLHTDQLSQAVLLRFAESGRLEQHRQQMLVAGRERLHAAIDGCEKYLPPGTKFTRPRGGMSLWVELPDPLHAAELLPRAEREGVTYLPGEYFAVSRPRPNGLRISFAGMTPEEIRGGLAILGRIFQEELERVRVHTPSLEAAALV